MSKQKKQKIDQDLPMEELEIGSVVYTTKLTSKFKNRKFWTRPDERKVVAVIPGKILKIKVAEGQEVEEGTSLLILEAMKMHNEIRAEFPGVIHKIYVSEGQMVSKSHLLVEFK
jgi:biotin carboxyl carrier protein